MRRLFTKFQRRILLFIAAGRCQHCSVSLQMGFHADHVIPYSQGGSTLTTNGQALCQVCNLKKGAKC